MFQWLFALMAEDAGVGFTVHGLPDFRQVGGMNDPALLAHYPDLGDILLMPHILDYSEYVIGLILQHRVAGTLGDHLRNLRNVTHRILQQLIPLMLDDKKGKKGHRDRQRDRDIEADFELKGAWKHSCLRQQLQSECRLLTSR